jgi:hypothetical protein
MKWSSVLAAAVVATSASPALAQRICSPDSTGRFLLCQDLPGAALDETMRASQDALARAQAHAAVGPDGCVGLICTFEQIQRQARYEHAGKLMAQGKCEEARAYALSKGDFELVGAVDQQCRPATAPPTSASAVGQVAVDPTVEPTPTTDTQVRMWLVKSVDMQGWTYAGFDAQGAYLYASGGPTKSGEHTFQLEVNDELFKEGSPQSRMVRILTFRGPNLKGAANLTLDAPNAQWAEFPAGSWQSGLFQSFCKAFDTASR